MRDLVQFVSQMLVEHPDQIDLSEDDEGLLLVVADGDLGSVIGHRGKTARAMRSVLSACGGPDLEITSQEELDKEEAEDDDRDGGSGADGADED